MYSRDNEANKNTGESYAQILASYRQKERESSIKKTIAKEKNKKAVALSKQKKSHYQITLAREVNILEVEKASMSHKITSLKEEIKVLMDNNKELKSEVDVTKYLEAEFQRLKEKSEQMTVEIEQRNVATAEQIDMLSMDTIMFQYQPNNNLQQTSPGYIDLDQIDMLSMDPNMVKNQPNNNLQQIIPGYLNLDQFDTLNMQFMNPYGCLIQN